MKITFNILLVFVTLFTGCQQAPRNLEVRNNPFSDQTKEWKVKLNYPVFSSSDPAINESCEAFNRQLRQFVAGLQDSLKTEAQKLFQDLANSSISRPAWICELNVTDSVFMATREYISLRLTVYTFMGGAHGITDFYAFNYDVKNRKQIDASEITDTTATRTINRLLCANFRNPEHCFSTEPTLDLVSVINFTPENVCFTFARYSLGAYACGSAEITVPRIDLGKIFLPGISK